MKISFQNVVPAFLAGTTHFTSQIWQTDLQIAAGTRVLVRAQSGKGKTTFLSYIFGARTGYSGNILLDEKNIASFNLNDWSGLRQTKLSMLFQELRLFENLTVRENLELKRTLTNSVAFDEVYSYLEQMGVKEFINKPCGLLSTGQKQRVAIAQSLSQPFSLLLMDEPFSHLDEMNTGIAMKLIMDRCNANRAGLMISSLGTEYNFAFDRILEL